MLDYGRLDSLQIQVAERLMIDTRKLLAPLILFPQCVALAGLPAPSLRTVAITGDQAPGPVLDIELTDFFGNIALNIEGEVAFRTTLGRDGIGFVDGNAVVSEGAGQGLRLIAKTQTQVPGLPTGVVYGSNFEAPNINALGQVVFENQLAGIGVTNQTSRAILIEPEAGLMELVARSGNPIPSLPGAQYGFYVGGTLLTSGGEVGFLADVLGNRSALFTKRPGQPSQLVVREGDVIAGSLPGEEVDLFFGTVMNDAGHLAFSTVLDSGIPSQRAVVRQIDDSLVEVVARTGDVALGQPIGLTFGLVGPPGLNSQGDTTFLSVLRGDPANGSRDSIVIADGDGAASIIAVEDNPAPGQPAGVTYQSFNQVNDRIVINANGDVAFRARLDGFESPQFRPSAVFVHSGGITEAVVSNGDPLSDRPTLSYIDTLTPPALNASGQVALLAALAGPDVGLSGSRAIVGTDRNGQLRTVVREGDAINVSTDSGDPDLRILEAILFHGGYGNDDGRPSAFNDVGQVAFIGRFNDGSTGVFVSDALTIPEPSTAALTLAAVVAGITLRRLAR